MTRGQAEQAARELVKSYVENQTMHFPRMDDKATGDGIADTLIAMHAKLAAYFEKSG